VNVEPELRRLRGLLESDLAGFVAALAEHLWFETLLVGLLPLVQAHAEVIAALRAVLPSHRKEQLERWLARTLLTLPTPHSVEHFCQLATARARRLAPAFPALEPAGLVETSRFFCGSRREADARVDGVGWTLCLESVEVGPGEAIHTEEWVATAFGPALRVTRTQTDDSSTVWEEAHGR
jgi:hypothetical protein